VLAILYTKRDSAVLCLHNFADEPREIRLDLELSRGDRLRSLLGDDERHGSAGRHRLRLEPLGYEWYRIG
jgi:maltose alpha-D-glucosyltransferase / alpha-amylase